MHISLIKNPDIIADVAQLTQKPFTVGFAAETQDVEQYAKGKLKNKQLDLIAANNVAVEGQGFNSDDNALTVYGTSKFVQPLALNNKLQLAQDLVAVIAQQYDEKTNG